MTATTKAVRILVAAGISVLVYFTYDASPSKAGKANTASMKVSSMLPVNKTEATSQSSKSKATTAYSNTNKPHQVPGYSNPDETNR